MVRLLLLSIGFIICAMLLFALWRNERSITSQLMELKERRGTNQKLENILPFPSSEKMVNQINGILEEYRDERAQLIRKIAAYREEVLNISHDLRTPLTSMRGYLSLIEEETKGDSKLEEYLRIVQGKNDVLEELVENFYEISQLEVGELTIRKEEIELKEFLSEILLAFYGDFQRKQLEVLVEFPEEPLVLELDRSLTLRVVTNILQNVLRYGVGTFRIVLNKLGPEVQLSFENELLEPISEAEIHRLFERSYRTDSARSGKGLGLGLYIAMRYSKAQGAKMTAHTNGYRFIIQIVFGSGFSSKL